ncbi:protein of unknown function [Singulisphaera sp. GP187]|uniref:family 16 glycoside hydrolase n=1 Tax=Singulisphaera sp. GP187 TaxID=1882752 RepID=UPI000927F3B3|nr:family 16 glycoside hydrolase [Singulisphaera sp. GP187]SIO41784.1 protein of unknown function [Singulisphaera sp. GP187]
MPLPLSPRSKLACTGAIALSGLFACLAADGVRTGNPVTRWRQHDIQRPKPPVVEPSEAGIVTKPPKDAVVLFDGTNLDAWKSPAGKPWKVVDGTMETVPGSGMIETKGKYGDIQLHIEWAAPNPPKGKGQDRGNSGIFLMGQFEIQVLDSYKAETYADGQAGAIYGQYPPLFNASRPPGEWQAFDIAFRRPRFDSSGTLLEPARITVFHNGVLVQNNEEPFGPTSWLKWLPYEDQGERGPITLQDHNHPVRYRNIWLRELPKRPAPPTVVDRPKTVKLATDLLDRYAGQYRLNPNAKPNDPQATIAREGDHLTISFPFRPRPLALEPISETQFDMPYTDGRFTFQTDNSGQVTGVHFRIGDGERQLMKSKP